MVNRVSRCGLRDDNVDDAVASLYVFGCHTFKLGSQSWDFIQKLQDYNQVTREIYDERIDYRTQEVRVSKGLIAHERNDRSHILH